MVKYFLKRLISLMPKILIISIIIFIAIQLAPGDPVTRLIPVDQIGRMTSEQLEAKKELLGLNDSLIEQYFRWIGGVIQGDFGYSQASGSSIGLLISGRLLATFELTLVGLIIGAILGISLGYISAIKQNTPIDYINTGLGMFGLSIPQFFFGLTGILIFGIILKWLPTGGRMAIGESGFFQRIKYLIMPAVCLGISLVATLMRYTRASMLDVINKDYIKAARSKGISEFKVYTKHCFRNAMLPIMVIIIFRIPMLVGGSVVIEAVFNYPGMGGLLLDAISSADMPVVMIVAMIISIVILISSFLIDIVAAALDPRIRLGKTGA